TPLHPTPTSPLFPYTTLFRSRREKPGRARRPERQPARPVTGYSTDSVGGLRSSSSRALRSLASRKTCSARVRATQGGSSLKRSRSEEHTSELQSLRHLVCRLL